MKMPHSAPMAATLAVLLALCALPAGADELQDASKLFKQGNYPQALERVDKFLAAKPKDAQGRFLKGLILTEQNKPQEAIKVFAALSEDYPELPEPYNNLAVLYAAQGQYDKARSALELAIRTHPSYATAHENLGDIYAKMASQAYDKALQLDKANTSAQTKLGMIKELFSRGGTPIKTAQAKPGASGPVTAAAKPAEPAKPAEKPAAAAKPAEKPAEKPAPKPATAGEEAEALAAVNAWAKAWSDKDVATYLAAYARDFKTPKGEARADWEKARRERIQKPKSIQVTVADAKVRITAPGKASVTFRQSYRSDTLKTSTVKTLALAKADGKWLIEQERVGP